MLKRVEIRTDRFTIAKMTLADWPDVQSIYAQGIDGGQATFETRVPEWKEWDASHHRFGRLVARRQGKVVGWAALAPTSTRTSYRGVAELSVYVSGTNQRQGIGSALLTAVIEHAEQHGLWTVQGSLFPENIGSIRLLMKCGFREVGRRKRIAQLDGEWRDTVLFERRKT